MTRIFLRIWLFFLGVTVAGMAIGLLIFLTIGNAHANAVLAQPFQPTAVNRMVSSSSLVTASTRFAGVTAANQSVYAVRAVEIGKASVANAIRLRAFNPWGLALVTALTVAGYQLQNDEIINPAGDQNGIQGECFNSNGTRRSASTNFAWCMGATNNAGTFKPHNQAEVYNWSDRSKFADATPTTNDQLFDFYRTLSPSQQADILTNPYTGFPDAANIPEFQTAADQISSNWNANNDGNPDTVPNPDPTEQTSTEPFPEEAQEQDICKANPGILACEELGETPDETPIDEQELPFDYQPVSFSGNASCPASIQMGGGIQYDYDAACSFASGVKPAVITMALLTGVFVMGGFRR